MKLLDKDEIVQKKNLERKFEIDEGVKLASTIDTLRDTKAKEEKTLKVFRDASFTQIKKDLAVLGEQKVFLTEENRSLQEQNRILRIPLDDEWKTLKEEKQKLEESKKEHSSNISEFLEQSRALDKREKDLESEEEDMNEERAETRRLLEGAVETSGQAKFVLAEATKTAEAIITKAEVREKEVISRELTVSARERDIISSKELLDSRKVSLDIRERKINDKYEQLLRTTKEAKKHG